MSEHEEFSLFRMEKSRIGAPEGVPRHSFFDTESLNHRLDVPRRSAVAIV